MLGRLPSEAGGDHSDIWMKRRDGGVDETRGMSETADVIVIGAGIIGCSIALETARAGSRVICVDRGPAAGAGSTSSSSACIRFNYSTLDGVIAAWEAMHLWKDWESFLGGDDEAGLARFHRLGVLTIEPPGARAATVTALFDKVGVPYERLASSQLAARFPALDTGRYFPPKQLTDPAFWADAPDPITAIFTPGGGFVDDPQRAAHNLMTAACRYGATFRFRSEVSRTEYEASGWPMATRSSRPWSSTRRGRTRAA
jgi:sarcosine oxidase subunit beta